MRSGVQIPPGPPAILTGEMIYPVDVGVGVRVALVQIGRQGLSEKLPHLVGFLYIINRSSAESTRTAVYIRKRESMQASGIRSDKCINH